METGSTIHAPIRRLDAIESQKGALIDKVVQFFNDRQNSGDEVVPVPKAQLQNLVRLAGNTSSPKEVCLFIRYQIGREDPRKPRTWKWRKGEFGERLIANIEEVAQIPQQQRDVGESGVAAIDLVRLFLGYFQREAVYRRGGEEGEEEGE